MLVKELIEELRKCDGEAIVQITFSDGFGLAEVFNVTTHPMNGREVCHIEGGN